MRRRCARVNCHGVKVPRLSSESRVPNVRLLRRWSEIVSGDTKARRHYFWGCSAWLLVGQGAAGLAITPARKQSLFFRPKNDLQFLQPDVRVNHKDEDDEEVLRDRTSTRESDRAARPPTASEKVRIGYWLAKFRRFTLYGGPRTGDYSLDTRRCPPVHCLASGGCRDTSLQLALSAKCSGQRLLTYRVSSVRITSLLRSDSCQINNCEWATG